MPNIKIAMGVGGSFDFISGHIKRAPLFLRRLGLEWMYRLIQEPRRIGRIFNATIKFVLLVFYTKNNIGQNTTTNKAREFLKKSFQNNSSYSFGDWTIMYNHSLRVKEYALQIAESIECDKELLYIEALFHDIGKAYKTNLKILKEQHARLGFAVAGSIMLELNISATQRKKLESFLCGDINSVEGRIIKDADILAFFSDIKLQSAFKNWAEKEMLFGELQRKADKINKLQFNISKKIAEPLYQSMKRQWHLK
mgnify:FL=1